MNNQPAFPTNNWQKIVPMSSGYSEGMTLRDYFAAQALSGLINYSPEPSEHESIARLCYLLADAMMKAREV
jgi:hypothetical protein